MKKLDFFDFIIEALRDHERRVDEAIEKIEELLEKKGRAYSS